MLDPDRVDPLVSSGRDLSPEECAAAARAAAALVDLAELERGGDGFFELLWRTPHSEA